MLHDYLISLIRTTVPVAVGSLLAWLASRAGIVLHGDSSTALIAAAVALAILPHCEDVREAIQRRALLPGLRQAAYAGSRCRDDASSG